MCSWLLHFLVFQKLLRQSFTIGDAQHRSLLPQRLHPVTVSVLHKFCYVSLKIFMKVLLLWDSFGSGIMKRLAGTHIIAKNSICFCRKQQCGQNKRYVYFLFFWHFFHCHLKHLLIIRTVPMWKHHLHFLWQPRKLEMNFQNEDYLQNVLSDVLNHQLNAPKFSFG